MIATCLGLHGSVSGIPPGFEAQARTKTPDQSFRMIIAGATELHNSKG